MNDQKFKAYMEAARTLGGYYAAGYQRGLRRLYHGEAFGTEADHQKWLAMDGHRQEQGDGYRDGFAGSPPRGFHGNTGRRNAAHDVTPDSHLHIRVPSSKKAAYVKAAQADGVKLSEWVISRLDAATGE